MPVTSTALLASLAVTVLLAWPVGRHVSSRGAALLLPRAATGIPLAATATILAVCVWLDSR